MTDFRTIDLDGMKPTNSRIWEMKIRQAHKAEGE